MQSFKVTDPNGNVYVMIPVDTEARREIDEGKFMDFDPDYFTSQLSQDQKELKIGLNGVPIGVEAPLKFAQDNAQGIVLGADLLLNGGALTDAASIDVPNNALSTLATAQSTLTLNVDVGASEVPNFAVEVIPSVDCTLTVTKTVGSTTTTLNPSMAGGDSLTTGKLYQVTCVGSCWTLAEFAQPTP
jgi:hypothetical protein